ncbi:MAG: hypothetical protein PHN64_03805 [Desulfovibrionaceae bacterium]|nr:hypothetical protein [Desulfovibrionaceae bacterium]
MAKNPQPMQLNREVRSNIVRQNMGTPRSRMGRFTMSEFKRRMRVLNEKQCTTAAQVQAVLREMVNLSERATRDGIVMILIEAFQQLQHGTPVDTGRAQAAWLITGNDGALGFVPGKKEASYAPQAPNPSELAQASVIYVLNNVEYILALNAGWSKKQPAGFIDDFLLRVKTELKTLAQEISAVQ